MAKQTTRQTARVSPTKDRAGERAIEARRAVERAPGLDNLIHERVRLGIISALAANEQLSFSELKALLKTTDGNISVHARKLEEAEYVTCTKSFDGRVPKTEYMLTDKGRTALEQYLNHMEALIKAARTHGTALGINIR